MISHTLNPVLLDLGLVQIRWYGLFYALGFVISYFLIYYVAKKKQLSLTKDDVSDLIFYSLLGTIIGARLFYVLFYNFSYFISNPLEIVAVWNGGLSFHGGFVGVIVAMWYFCKKHKLHFYDISDIVAIPTMLALGLGRIGNLFNGELWGHITSVPWCLDYSSNPHLNNPPAGCRHPSQVYEFLYSVAGFALLWVMSAKNFPKGTLTWTFVLFYGVFRSITEFFRWQDPSTLFLGVLTTGQMLSVPMIVIGGYMLYHVLKVKQ